MSQHVAMYRARNIELSSMCAHICVCVCALMSKSVDVFVYASSLLLMRTPCYSCHVHAVC